MKKKFRKPSWAIRNTFEFTVLFLAGILVCTWLLMTRTMEGTMPAPAAQENFFYASALVISLVLVISIGKMLYDFCQQSWNKQPGY